jgi:hypothetical protein
MIMLGTVDASSDEKPEKKSLAAERRLRTL